MSLPKLVVFFATICVSATLEEAEPAIFLRPRDFNPHPYQQRTEFGTRPVQRGSINGGAGGGPVLFPRTPPDPDGDSGAVNGIEDGPPYTSLARKRKYKQSGRFFEEQENKHASPEILKALGAHAAKVLGKKPLSSLGVTGSDLSTEEKGYAFAYKVKDRKSGDDFSHVQQHNSATTNGEYRVKLPDGRVQIVSYVADKDGYKADVKYAENANSDSGNNPQAYPPSSADPVLEVQQVRPAVQIAQNRIKAKPYDYVYGDYNPATNDDEETEPSLYHLPLYHYDHIHHHHTHRDEEEEGVPGLKGRNLVQLIVTPMSASFFTTPHSEIVVTPQYENQLQINPYLILRNNEVRTAAGAAQRDDGVGGDDGGLFRNNIHERRKVVLQINGQQQQGQGGRGRSEDDGEVGKFIGSTLATAAPYTLDSSKGFHENVLSGFPLDSVRYSQVQIDTPDFKLVQRQNHHQFHARK